MAEGGDHLTSFIVVEVDGDLKDFENEDTVYHSTKSYLEDISRSGGSKFTSAGFVKNQNSQRLQYVAHYANLKSAERVLKRHEHCIKVNDKNLVLTVRPCPPDLQKVLEKESASSDGEGDGTGNSSNGESSPLDEGRAKGQNSSGNSDIEIISHDEPNGFTLVDVEKGTTRHASAVSTQPRDEARSSSRDSSSCGSPENSDYLSTTGLDQWSRSIVIENVSDEMFPTLRLLLENKRKGGGSITTYERNPVSSQVLVTFEELEVAQRFQATTELNFMKQTFPVIRPMLIEYTKDTLSEESDDKNKNAEAKNTANAAASTVALPEVTEDAGLLEKVQEKVEENRAEEQKREIQGGKELRKKDEVRSQEPGRDEQEEIKAEGRDSVEKDDVLKPKESEDEDVDDGQKKEEKVGSDSEAVGTAAAKGKNEGEATGDADQSSINKLSKEDSVTTSGGTSEEKQIPNTGKTTEEEYELSSPLKGPAGRKDETSSKGDTSGSESSLDVSKTPKSIIVRGVSADMMDIVEIFLEDPKQGGGTIRNVQFNESDGELSVFFEDDVVADKFLSLESFSILENKFYVLTPEKKSLKDVKRQSPGDSLESREEAEEEGRKVEVRGVNSSAVSNLIVSLMKHKRKGGGAIERESLNENSGILTVQFQDKKIADRFLEQKSISMMGKSYEVHAPARAEPKSILLEELKNREAEDRSRTVEVHGVQSKAVAETIVALLENKRRGGGSVEEDSLNENNGILTVKFEEKRFAEHFLREEVISASGVSYYIRLPSGPAVQPEITNTPNKRQLEEELSDKDKSLNDEDEGKLKDGRSTDVPEYREEVKETHVFDYKDKHDDYAVPGYTVYERIPAEELEKKLDESTKEDLPTGEPCVIEVQGIPDNATDAVVTMIFENKRFSGIADVVVVNVEMLGGGRAVVTIKEPQHTKALIEKGHITYKSHTLAISKPLKSEPVEESNESSVQHRFSNVVNETPDGNASGPEQSVSGVAIDVANIPEDMAEASLLMIFESKRLGGGGEVKNIIYNKGRGSAVITMSDPEVANRLVSQESVVFKDTKFMVTKHVEEDRSQKPSFPSRKRSNVPTEVKEQPSLADRTIKVTNIPSDVNKETLEMVFESRRNDGGVTDNITYDQERRTAVITFKDPEVARTLLRKEFLMHRGSRLAITASVEEPVEGSIEDQVSSVSSRTVDVSDIPLDVTTEMLTMLLENSSGGEIESIDHNQDNNTAVATFRESSSVDDLISKESVVYKGKRLSIAKHVEKVEKRRIPKDKPNEPPVASNRSISVSQIPEKLNKDYLIMFFENKRSGGGKIEQVDYDQEQRTAVITFEDPKVAASFLEKKIVDFKGQHMMVTRPENKAADAERDDDSGEKSDGKEPLNPKYTVSGSFNTVKVSGLTQNTSEDMISMYFENKKRSGGGKLQVLEHQKEKGKAVIKFHEVQDGIEVCKRSHVLSDATLKISALEMPLDDVKSCAIEVKSLGERTSEDLLAMYFENRARSGGGPVEKVFLDRGTRTAIVVFEEAVAILGVMKKQPHKLEGAAIEVNVLEPAPPPPLLLGDVDTRKLLAKRLPPSVTRDSLQEYLSPAAKAKIVGWTVAVKPSTALLNFSSEPDYLSIRSLICSKPFLGKMISIRRVPLTSSILVTGIPSSISADFVAMYFENPRNGGTGDDCKVEMLPDKSSAIVEFKRPDVIHAVTSRMHLFEKKEVKVMPYYPWLGLISASESSGNVPGKIPTSVTLTFDPRAVHFILKCPEFQKYIEDSLEKMNCCVIWPSEGKGEVKLEYRGKEKQKPTSGWDGECGKFLQRFADELTWKKENILQEIWNDFKTQIQEQPGKVPKQLDIAFENDQCEIQYMGLKKHTDEFEKFFKKIKGELEGELERKKKRISETMINLKPHQLALIRTEEFMQLLLQHKIPDLEFEVKQTEVYLCGMPDVVKKAKLIILEKVTAAVQDSFEISEATSRLFAKAEAKPYLMEQLLSKSISASWTCNDRSVVVYVLHEKNLKEAVEVLRKGVVEEHIQLSKASEELVQSGLWKDFIGSLYSDLKSLEIAVMGPTVVSVSTLNIAEDVRKRLNGFINKHAIFEKVSQMDLGVVEVIEKYMKNELRKIDAELKECYGGITASPERSGFIIKGNEAGADKAGKELLKLTDSIVMYDHDIDRPGIPAYFYSKHGKEVLRGIQINHKVSIQLDNTQSRAKPEAAAADEAGRCRVEVRPGKFMILMRGDITKFRGDAIVNAANEDLKNIGGVALSIAEAAGSELGLECFTRVKLEGRLLPGQACVTTAGKLPCKKVIHAVGPRWSGGNSDEENILAMAVDSSLFAADSEGLKSIALPLISTGIFNFPLYRATDIIVDAVKNYFVDNGSSTVREVYFIDSDTQAVASLEKKLRSIEAEGPPERSEAAKKGRKVVEQAGSRPPQGPQPGSSPRVVTPGNPTSGFKALSSDVIQTAEGVRITLVKGSISALKADVLVNTTGKELNLTHGNVSKSLLDVAGSALQSEVDSKKPRDFDYGQVVVTGGHKLKCNFVYHGSCRGWDSGAGNCERTVRNFMKNLLEKAEFEKQKSIAIPAIGTGNLKIPHRIVTEIMYSEVEKFSSNRKPMNLLDVRFIVYDRDRESIKAFEDRIEDLLRKGGSGGAAAAAAPGRYAPSQQASSSSSGASYAPSPSASSGADFSFDQVKKVIRIGAIEMKLTSGDITKERADAIVNSTNDRMDMSGGAVSKAILRAGGRVVEAECKRAKMSSRRVCVTSGGDLPAKNIIHLVAGYNPSAWQEVIENTLEEAEGRGFKDIVFPMLGTGQIGQSASAMAGIMVDAVCEFNKTKRPKNLREIKVCIFQSSMLSEFVDAVANKGTSASASNSFRNRAAEEPVGGATQRTRAVIDPQQQGTEQQEERHPQHLSRIILSIYALSRKAIDDVLKDIEEVIGEYIIDKVLDTSQDQERIAKLNPEQVKRIKDMTSFFPVQIEVETGRMKRIRIRGPPMEVTSVIDQVHNIFQEAQKKEIKKKEEEWIASVAHWEYNDGTDFENYPDEINAIIETAFREKKPYAEWEEENAKYRLTFDKMVEEFMTKPGTPPVKVRRVAKEMDVPTSWETMKNGEELKRVTLNATDQEYKDVEKAAKSTAQTTINQIVKIERIQNKLLYKQYVVRKAAMDAGNPGKQNEMTLWHGTSADTLESINRMGFNRSYCGKNATVYGRGVYFAKNFSYSAQNTYSPLDANGLKHVYQCKVLTGEYILGNQNMIVPPAKPGSTTLTYDSTVDNGVPPTIFVIFYDTQAFPEYLIYFK